METELQKFYKNKTIFLTGGTGFLGKVFTEKLLRVTEVHRIYLLIRPKKNKEIFERLNDVFEDPLFDQLKKLKPNPIQRIVPISGDCALPRLGISNEDCAKLIENVDIVVHSAATVRFNEPVSVAVAINTRATLDLLQIAKKMTNLKAFVHVSSAFANCNELNIEERFYTEMDKAITSENVCKLADICGPSLLNEIPLHQICMKSPNTYCFTKKLAEEAVLKHGSSLPICIFRPGIVTPTYEDPLPGWTDNLHGPTGVLHGAAHGIWRVMYLHMDINAHLVPVDFCASVMITSAWQTATVARREETPPPIYNLVPDEKNFIKWGNKIHTTEAHGSKMPLTSMLWFPFLICTDSRLLYKLLCFLYHTIPAYMIDLTLVLTGQKRRMVRTYEKIHKQIEMFSYFVENEWVFSIANTKKLWNSLSLEDQKLFNFSMLSIDWNRYFYDSLLGMRQYVFKESPSTIPKGIKLRSRLLLIHRATQLLIIAGIFSLIIWIIF